MALAMLCFWFWSGLAFPSDHEHGSGISDAAILFVQEAVGGAGIGLFLGWLVFRVMRQIDDYPLEVLLTLAGLWGIPIVCVAACVGPDHGRVCGTVDW